MAWENWLIGLEVNKGIRWQPGEWERDGVYGTPDGVGECLVPDIDLGDLARTGTRSKKVPCLEEFKLTWKSLGKRRDITKELGWMWQLMGNCYVLGLQVARLHVCWVNGEYGEGYFGMPAPVYMRYTIRFSEGEMEAFWDKVVVPNRGVAVPEEGKGQG
jgi:hypothetical protein